MPVPLPKKTKTKKKPDPDPIPPSDRNKTGGKARTAASAIRNAPETQKELNKVKSESTYWGVPKNYLAPVYNPDSPTMFDMRRPLYQFGDELDFTGWRTEDILALQQQLKKAGLFTSTFKPSGVWDKKSRGAMIDLMTDANLIGSDWQSLLTQRLEGIAAAGGGRGGGGGGGGGGGLSLQEVTNPMDIEALGQDTAQAVAGRKLLGGEVGQFVGAYQGMERTAPPIEGGQFVVAPPSPKVFAEKQVRGQLQAESSAHDLAGQFNSFASILSKGIG